jgi:hypothetical protein
MQAGVLNEAIEDIGDLEIAQLEAVDLGRCTPSIGAAACVKVDRVAPETASEAAPTPSPSAWRRVGRLWLCDIVSSSCGG